MSMDLLIEKIVKMKNPTVAGLDPKLDYIPEHLLEEVFAHAEDPLEGAANALYTFNKGLIDALCDIVPAVKPQAAYYEMYGWQGMRALTQTIAYAHEKGMYVITDGKRNDIGSTMEAYAAAHLGKTEIRGRQVAAFGGDSLTVNGYLGTDGVEPLLKVCKEHGKSMFILVKTSNPSSGELQDLKLGDKTVYETMGQMCEQWGQQLPGKYGYSSVGAVVGATYPSQLEELRGKMPHTFFLVPGYGAQGGGAQDVRHAFDSRGLGAIINSSRGIMCAYKKSGSNDYAQAAREEALRMKKDLLDVIGDIAI